MTMKNGEYVLPPLAHRRSPNYSSRGGRRVTGLVFHVTVGSYLGAIDWLCEPTMRDRLGNVVSGPDASAHLVIREDGNQATQLVPIGYKAWHGGDANPSTIGVELAAPNHDLELDVQLRSAARVGAALCHWEGIPPVWSMRHGGVQAPGITRHGDWGELGGGHYQCPMTSEARWLYLIALVQREYARGGFLTRAEWGLGV